MLTQDELKKIFHYSPETGVFTRLKTGKNTWCKDAYGYFVIHVNGKKYYLHRLAWLYIKGEMPKDQIDHINLNKTDNRIFNLRECSNQQNSYNRAKRYNNKSGFKGVSLHRNKWMAQSSVNGKRIHIGTYETVEEARDAYINFVKLHHGEFAKY